MKPVPPYFMSSPITPEYEVSAQEPIHQPFIAGRVVFALSTQFINHHRSSFEKACLSGIEGHWVDVNQMSQTSWRQTLAEINPEILVTGWNSNRVPEDYLPPEQCALRYVCHLTGSVREVVSRAQIEKGLLVTNWGDSISHTIAEHAVLLVLSCLRNQPQWGRVMREWPTRRMLPTRRLRGKRVGIHGFGAVAREIVQLLRPFGVTLTAYSKGVPTDLYEQHRVRPAPNLESLFADSDVLIECEGLNSGTEGSVTEQVLSRLPVGAVFVNVARSRLVNEDVLARIAHERNLRLGVDVFAAEPPSADLSLLQVPDAIFSPHIAGPTMDAFPVLVEYALDNISRYLIGEDLLGQVTLAAYDRAT